MRTVTLTQPQRIVFGREAIRDCCRDMIAAGFERVLVVTSPPTAGLARPLVEELCRAGRSVTVYDAVASEPTLECFDKLLAAARAQAPDAVVGLGGGSALDAAKLAAALWDGQQDVREVFGIDLLTARRTYLACLPTTAGTGSEVSPNAILLDTAEQLKKGVVSRHLVPDAAYIDPLLTVSMPTAVTAGTGLDALTHCIEAYTNRFAHPAVDLYALEGIRLIGAHLERAVKNGVDLDARDAMALGSMYGGLCLGPVNTAAVHALAYPLGGQFHVAHGVSNAVLLPQVMEFNLVAAPERYARVAEALGVEPASGAVATARRGVERVRRLARECGVPQRLSDLGIPASSIPGMARAAMNVTRLLKNNPRELTVDDAEAIYRAAQA